MLTIPKEETVQQDGALLSGDSRTCIPHFLSVLEITVMGLGESLIFKATEGKIQST